MSTEAKTDSLPAPGKYLTFKLGKEFYSLPVLKVREIMRLCPITMVPRMPPYLRGVINLRGKIVPVVDLRTRFGMPPLVDNDRACIIVVQLAGGNKSVIGVIVDSVEDVSPFEAGDIEPTPDFGDILDTQFILGMSKVKGTVKAILDIDQILLMDGQITLHLPGNTPEETEKA
jgi:purine-binding chemotaxis protein CheW